MFLMGGMAVSASMGYAAILINGGTPAVNHRFENDPAFIAAGADLSGVARSPSNRWGTLVGPSVFLSANHYHPEPGQTLVFYAGNDPLGPSVTRTVVAGQRVGISDVWAGILDSPMPSGYQPLPIFTAPLSSDQAFQISALNGLEVYMVGRSDDINNSTTNMAFGRNVMDRWWTDVDGSGSAMGATYDTRPNRQVPYEAILRTYDSGAPVLAEVNGALTVLGFNWFIYESTLLSYSGFSYVGNQAAAIQDLLQSFASGPSSSYTAWMLDSFPGASPLAERGPAADFDGDGLSNFTEYALFFDPTQPVRFDPLSTSIVTVDSQDHLSISFKAREDATVLYTLRVGANLQSATSVVISYSGGTWISSRPDILILHQTSSPGIGVWNLELRSAQALAPGGIWFVSLQVP